METCRNLAFVKGCAENFNNFGLPERFNVFNLIYEHFQSYYYSILLSPEEMEECVKVFRALLFSREMINTIKSEEITSTFGPAVLSFVKAQAAIAVTWFQTWRAEDGSYTLWRNIFEIYKDNELFLVQFIDTFCSILCYPRPTQEESFRETRAITFGTEETLGEILNHVLQSAMRVEQDQITANIAINALPNIARLIPSIEFLTNNPMFMEVFMRLAGEPVFIRIVNSLTWRNLAFFGQQQYTAMLQSQITERGPDPDGADWVNNTGLALLASGDKAFLGQWILCRQIFMNWRPEEIEVAKIERFLYACLNMLRKDEEQVYEFMKMVLDKLIGICNIDTIEKFGYGVPDRDVFDIGKLLIYLYDKIMGKDRFMESLTKWLKEVSIDKDIDKLRGASVALSYIMYILMEMKFIDPSDDKNGGDIAHALFRLALPALSDVREEEDVNIDHYFMYRNILSRSEILLQEGNTKNKFAKPQYDELKYVFKNVKDVCSSNGISLDTYGRKFEELHTESERINSLLMVIKKHADTIIGEGGTRSEGDIRALVSKIGQDDTAKRVPICIAALNEFARIKDISELMTDSLKNDVIRVTHLAIRGFMYIFGGCERGTREYIDIVMPIMDGVEELLKTSKRSEGDMDEFIRIAETFNILASIVYYDDAIYAKCMSIISQLMRYQNHEAPQLLFTGITAFFENADFNPYNHYGQQIVQLFGRICRTYSERYGGAIYEQELGKRLLLHNIPAELAREILQVAAQRHDELHGAIVKALVSQGTGIWQ